MYILEEVGGILNKYRSIHNVMKHMLKVLVRIKYMDSMSMWYFKIILNIIIKREFKKEVRKRTLFYEMQSLNK
jgi:hypothetical protein